MPEKILRLTKQRVAIINDLRNHSDHPSASLIHCRIKKVVPGISLTTVYRNLEFLVENGDVLKIFTPTRIWRYDGDNSEHHHLCCENCGHVFDLPSNVDFELDIPDEWISDFHVRGYTLDILGSCKECKKNNTNKANRGSECDKTGLLDTESLRILKELHEAKSLTSCGTLSQATGLDKNTVFARLRRLRSAGFVESPQRAKYTITNSGISQFENTLPHRKGMEEKT